MKRFSTKKIHMELTGASILVLCLVLFLPIAGIIGITIYSSKQASDPRHTAMEALEFYLMDSEEITNAISSPPDSIFDFRFFSEKDSEEIMGIMGRLADITMSAFENVSPSNINEGDMTELSEYNSQAGVALQAMMRQMSLPSGLDSGKFSGWKVKIIYEKRTESGKTVKLQKWFLIDPTGKHILQSYDLPVLVATNPE